MKKSNINRINNTIEFSVTKNYNTYKRKRKENS